MIPRYFAPTFRLWYAAMLAQRKGQEAWRHFIRVTADHETSDMRVRPLAVGRLRTFSLDLARTHAELGKNSGKPSVGAAFE